MFLRSITIRGFKSFADKTVLEFQPGVSVIVGANGSGKSNLVDAISWVLGEQGARALRGGHMADVIFAGTPSRPALGMAEVKLVIDNSAAKIPVPMSEIEVSRTIFRTGESEYRINGQTVRLLDVQELLSETGIGRALHTVVGQGQLEEVLLAKPEERRTYIEEAAGIAKHRRRKERAERKLMRTRSGSASAPGRADGAPPSAEAAAAAGRDGEEARGHSPRRPRSSPASWRRRGCARSCGNRNVAAPDGTKASSGARRPGERLDGLDAEVLAAADERAAASVALAEAEQMFRQTAVRSFPGPRTPSAPRSSGKPRRARSSPRQASRSARLDALDDELARVDGELARVLADLERRERELEDAEAAFHVAEQERRAAEEERRRLGEEAAGRRAEVEALERSIASSERERSRIAEALESVGARLAEVEAERDGLASEIETFDDRSAPMSQKRAQLEVERRTLVDKIEELDDIRRRHESRRDLLEARRRDLEETAGSRFLAAHTGHAVGLLKDLVRVESGFERALSAALGPLADAVVYDDADRALDDAHEGRRGHLGDRGRWSRCRWGSRESAGC